MLNSFACGGGSNANDQGIKGIPPILPVVTSVSPTTAAMGVKTTFSVTGTTLSVGMKFELANCSDVVDLGSASSTVRQFTCTPGPFPGPNCGNIIPGPLATHTIYAFQVTYQ